MFDNKPPTLLSSNLYYVERPKHPFVNESPDLLQKRGFEFLGNMPADSSIAEGVADLEKTRLEKAILEKGLPGPDEPRIVIKDLKSLVNGSLQAGFEIRLLKGVYDKISGKVTPDSGKVAAFQRFLIDKFISMDHPKKLEKLGYFFELNLPFHSWGDKQEKVHPDLVGLLQEESKAIEAFILKKENSGYRVKLAPGFYKIGDFDFDAQNLSAFVKKK